MDEGVNSFTFSGRNRLGFQLSNQTFDERTSFTGSRTQVLKQMLEAAGVSQHDMLVMADESDLECTFDSEKTIFEGISEVVKVIDWYMDDQPDGRIVIGDAAFIKDNVATTGIYTFHRGEDVISRYVQRQIDGVYSRVCVRRDGESPLNLFAEIPFFDGWALASHRTFYQNVPDNVDDVTMERILAQYVEEMQYSGITESFEGMLRPWLQVGDIAVVTGGIAARIAGIITEIEHRYGEAGFFTRFTVTSGGVISNPDNESLVATKYVNRLGGANRQRRIMDYVNSGINTLSGTSNTGEAGAVGSIGPKGDPGDDGASAYQIWQSLGNVGSEQDFINSLVVAADPVGTIRLWPMGSAPGGWLMTDGQGISRTTFDQLYTLLGSTYGDGDGTTTFNIPTIADPVTGVSYIIKVQ